MLAMKVLVIGVGSIGERHVRCLQRTGRTEVAICEINGELRQAVAERYGLDEVYSQLDDALQASFEAAVICTPAQLHVEMATRLADRKINLLIEKPLSTKLDGVAELVELVDRNGTLASVAYVYRAHPALAAMRQEVHSGRFGRPVQIVTQGGQHFPTYRPAYREIYYTARATGGGAIQDALTHVINSGQWLVGSIDCVAADAAHQVLDGVQVEDTVHVIARHGTVLGSYSLNQYQAPNEGTITVVCEAGTARFESHQNRWRWMTEPGGQWHDEPAEKLERDELFLIQSNHFLDVLEAQAEPLCTLDAAVETLRVNLAIIAAAERKQWVDPSSM